MLTPINSWFIISAQAVAVLPRHVDLIIPHWNGKTPVIGSDSVASRALAQCHDFPKIVPCVSAGTQWWQHLGTEEDATSFWQNMTIIIYFNDKRDLNDARHPYFHIYSIQLSSTQFSTIQLNSTQLNTFWLLTQNYCYYYYSLTSKFP